MKKSESTIQVNISSKWMHNKFCCSMEYIENICHGCCCDKNGKSALISLLPYEEEWFVWKGHKVIEGILQGDCTTKKCPMKTESGLCSLHNSKHKPFGCIASPFTLNRGKTLIIRQRYSVMRCHGTGDYAFKVFRPSLDLIFGIQEAQRICERLEKTKTDIAARMPLTSYGNLVYLDGLKHRKVIRNTLL